MRGVLRTSYLCISLIFSVGLFAQEEEKIKDKGLVVNIDLAQSEPYLGNQLGFPIDYLCKAISENDTALLRVFEELKPKLCRFPSGHAANFYNPVNQESSLTKEQVKAIKDTSIRFEINTFQALVKQDEELFDKVLSYLAEKKIALHYVANIYSADSTDFKAMLDKIEQSGVRLLGIELGYSLYHKMYRSGIKRAEQYLERAKAYTKIVKQRLPDVPVGLCISPIKKYHLNLQFDPENQKWNSRLSEAQFADAWFLPMLYSPSKCLKKNDIDRICDCVTDELIEYHLKRFTSYAEELKKVFGKEIWISSFGLEMAAALLHNNYLESAILFDFQKSFFEHNLQDSFRMTRYFVNKGYHPVAYKSLFSRKVLLEKEVDNKLEIYKRAAYYPLYFLADISNTESFKLIGSGASNIPNLIKTGRFSFSAFYTPDKLTAHFYLSNKSDIPVRLDAIYFKGKLRYRGSTGKIETHKLTASNWYSSVGVNAWVKESELYDNSELFMVYEQGRVQPRDLIIPPKSLYYIRIRMK